ncbi:MAG: hypothetical protein DLM52_10095 [Chthoniobacterales bacterium]|nr:MAG: hypothetical protein DLM52_10095 [Chthoniobacterales bacterium]
MKAFVPKPGESVRGHYTYGVTGDYFRAGGIALMQGRFISADDSHRAERACVVDEDLARRYWPNGNAIGQKIFAGSDERNDAEAFTVVGVVRAVKQAELTENAAQGAVYFPYFYRNDNELSLAVRLTQKPETFAPTLRSLVRQIDPDLPINHLQSMQVRIDDSLLARRSPALLSGIFAALALLLAGIGSHGVLSFAVAQHRREIAIRMALGAQPEQIGRQFLNIGLRLLVAGTLLGFVGAILSARAMQSLLYNIGPFEFTVFAVTAGIMALVCLLACWLPARRASRVDPAEALRAE